MPQQCCLAFADFDPWELPLTFRWGMAVSGNRSLGSKLAMHGRSWVEFFDCDTVFFMGQNWPCTDVAW